MLERELTVHDPRTGEEVGRVPIASAERISASRTQSIEKLRSPLRM